MRAFRQVDVFGAAGSPPYLGNPVAVVHDAEGLDTGQMQALASWTNLSETTFVLPPTAAADYRVRIFTPTAELPFAGHPTLGTAHAWLEAGGRPRSADHVVQECGAGLVRVRRDAGRLAFAAPPLVRSGPVEPALVRRLAAALGSSGDRVVAAQWVDNGPGWVALLLGSVEEVLALRPGPLPADVGAVALHPPGGEVALEVRAFFRLGDTVIEDPVTGSLNASVAQWLLGEGRLQAPYVARQGTALGRSGRAHVDRDPDGTVWVGGRTATTVTGTLQV